MTQQQPPPPHPEDERAHSGQEVDARTAHMELTWRCLNCGYTTERSPDPPEVCPNCGKPKEEFESVIED